MQLAQNSTDFQVSENTLLGKHCNACMGHISLRTFQNKAQSIGSEKDLIFIRQIAPSSSIIIACLGSRMRLVTVCCQCVPESCAKLISACSTCDPQSCDRDFAVITSRMSACVCVPQLAAQQKLHRRTLPICTGPLLRRTPALI